MVGLFAGSHKRGRLLRVPLWGQRGLRRQPALPGLPQIQILPRCDAHPLRQGLRKFLISSSPLDN